MDNAPLRRFVYGLLITITGAITTARIIGVELVHEPSLPKRWPKSIPEKMPTFSSNDRSRWATVRALVETGTYVVGRRVEDPTAEDGSRIVDGRRVPDPNAKAGYFDEGIAFQDGYKSVDMVLNPETKEFFSSKPPLFSTLAAGEYWLLHQRLPLPSGDFAFGWTLENGHDRWPVVCTILITFNLLPLIISLILLARLLEEYGTTDWGRLFVFASACFGTFLTTFAVTLNNHTPAACCAMFAVYALMRGRSAGNGPHSIGALIAAGLFAGLAAAFDLPAAALVGAAGLIVLFKSPRRLAWFVIPAAIPIAALLAINDATIGSIVPAYSKKDSVWYKYDGSHWRKQELNPNQEGIDFAHEPKEVYAFHMLLGHHGVFSLTPIWLLSLAGMIMALMRPSTVWRIFGALALALTATVCAFYIWKTNNYEGWTSGPRWQFWLTPLFLIAMLPAADGLASTRWGRWLGLALLAVSVFSATYPVWNPWRHPWAYQLCEYMNWLKY
jgi:hypothetical protein